MAIKRRLSSGSVGVGAGTMPASAASWAPDAEKKAEYILAEDSFIFRKVERAKILITYGLEDDDEVSKYRGKKARIEDDIKEQLSEFIEAYNQALSAEKLKGHSSTQVVKDLLSDATKIDIMLECYHDWPRSL